MTQLSREERREIATEYVDRVNSNTLCSHCGKQPIEWHNHSHVDKPNARVSSLRTQGASIARIEAEMNSSIPLCRSCHMKEDGRLETLLKSHPYRKGKVYVKELPCDKCGRDFKPLRKGLCYSCYQAENQHKWPSRNK